MPGGFASVILKAPAGRAVWLHAGHTEGGRWAHDIKVPGRGPGARRAVFGGEGATTHAGRPPLRVIAFHQALERRLIGNHAGAPLDDQVDPFEDDRDGAVRILREVLALARPRATHEIEPAVNPQCAHSRDVRPPVGPSGGQPVRVGCAVGFGRGRLEGRQRARPGNRWVAVGVEILLLHFAASYRDAEPRIAACRYKPTDWRPRSNSSVHRDAELWQVVSVHLDSKPLGPYLVERNAYKPASQMDARVIARSRRECLAWSNGFGGRLEGIVAPCMWVVVGQVPNADIPIETRHDNKWVVTCSNGQLNDRGADIFERYLEDHEVSPRQLQVLYGCGR